MLSGSEKWQIKVIFNDVLWGWYSSVVSMISFSGLFLFGYLKSWKNLRFQLLVLHCILFFLLPFEEVIFTHNIKYQKYVATLNITINNVVQCPLHRKFIFIFLVDKLNVPRHLKSSILKLVYARHRIRANHVLRPSSVCSTTKKLTRVWCCVSLTLEECIRSEYICSI